MIQLQNQDVFRLYLKMSLHSGQGHDGSVGRVK